MGFGLLSSHSMHTEYISENDKIYYATRSLSTVVEVALLCKGFYCKDLLTIEKVLMAGNGMLLFAFIFSDCSSRDQIAA